MLSEHGIKITPSIYCAQAKTPITLEALAEADLVNALMDLHSARVLGVGKLCTPPPHRP